MWPLKNLSTTFTCRVIALACGRGRVWSSSADQKVRVWDCESGECISEMRTRPTPNTDIAPGAINCLALTDDAVWGGTTTGVIHVWDTDSHELREQLGYQDPLFQEVPAVDQHLGAIEAVIAVRRNCQPIIFIFIICI